MAPPPNSSLPDPAYLIQARALHKTYQQGRLNVAALQGIHLDIPKKAFVVILGPSGGGKSTLLHLLGGIDRPTSGQVWVNGNALHDASEEQLTRFRRDHVGFVFQFYNLLPSMNALENVSLPLLAKGWSMKNARQRAEAILEEVRLTHRLKHKPGELSGGEQQRVAIARALIVEPAVILADEPTGDLDSVSAEGVVQLMCDLNQRLGTTFITVTHNQHLSNYATHLYHMQDGKLSR